MIASQRCACPAYSIIGVVPGRSHMVALIKLLEGAFSGFGRYQWSYCPCLLKDCRCSKSSNLDGSSGLVIRATLEIIQSLYLSTIYVNIPVFYTFDLSQFITLLQLWCDMRFRVPPPRSRDRQIPRNQLLFDDFPASHMFLLINRRLSSRVYSDIRCLNVQTLELLCLKELLGLRFRLEGFVEICKAGGA